MRAAARQGVEFLIRLRCGAPCHGEFVCGHAEQRPAPRKSDAGEPRAFHALVEYLVAGHAYGVLGLEHEFVIVPEQPESRLLVGFGGHPLPFRGERQRIFAPGVDHRPQRLGDLGAVDGRRLLFGLAFEQQREFSEIVGQFGVHLAERGQLLGSEQHLLALAHERRDQIGDGQRLARAGRSLDYHGLAVQDTGDDVFLHAVGGKHEIGQRLRRSGRRGAAPLEHPLHQRMMFYRREIAADVEIHAHLAVVVGDYGDCVAPEAEDGVFVRIAGQRLGELLHPVKIRKVVLVAGRAERAHVYGLVGARRAAARQGEGFGELGTAVAAQPVIEAGIEIGVVFDEFHGDGRDGVPPHKSDREYEQRSDDRLRAARRRHFPFYRAHGEIDGIVAFEIYLAVSIVDEPV